MLIIYFSFNINVGILLLNNLVVFNKKIQLFLLKEKFSQVIKIIIYLNMKNDLY